MRLAPQMVVTELRRRPAAMLRTSLALGVLMALAMVLASLVETIDRRSTGALRVVEADLMILNVEARQQVLRSRVPQPLLIPVGFVDGVQNVGVLSLLPSTVTHDAVVQRVMVAGFNARTPAEPRAVLEGRVPTDGEPNIAAVDATLRRSGIEVGDRIVLGGSLEVTVVGVVAEAGFLQQPTVWVPPEVWARLGSRAFPERGYADTIVGVGLVRLGPGADPDEVARDIVSELALEEPDADRADDEEPFAADVITLGRARSAVPGVSAIRVTFGLLVALAIGIVAVVAAGLMLLQVDRDGPRDAALRALGAGPGLLARTFVLRLTVVWLLASAVGVSIAVGLATAVPAGVPLDARPEVMLVVSGLLGVAVGAGGLVGLRRIVRIDPADAIGGARW